MCICMKPVASGTNGTKLNLLYPRFMRSLIPFQDIAFICLPYHHYFSSDWSSHEISLPFWRAHLPPLLSHSPPHITCSSGHLCSLQESLFLSSDHPLSVTEHIGLLILPGAILKKKKKKRGTEMTARASGRVRGHKSHYYQSIFFSFIVTCHFSDSHPCPQPIKPMAQFSSIEFDFGYNQCQDFLLCFSCPLFWTVIKESCGDVSPMWI